MFMAWVENGKSVNEPVLGMIHRLTTYVDKTGKVQRMLGHGSGRVQSA